MEIPQFNTTKELFDYLKANKELLIKSKKAAGLKKADPILVTSVDSGTEKSQTIDPDSTNKVTVEVVINTTGIMDSHKDVHIPGLWTKSLKENKSILLLQEHKMDFDHMISDQVKAVANDVSWKDLGFRFKGQTQALTFIAEVEKAENESMFKRYARGTVKEHSVGMQYVKIALAINSEDEEYKEEFATWNKYIDQVVNQKDAEDNGYFWAVTEAKVVEGSAVLKGSNSFTPTLSVESSKNIEAAQSTSTNEPLKDTRKSQFNTIFN